MGSRKRGVMVGSRDLVSGIIFLVSGAALAWKAQDYRMGTLVQMGPGYFPFLIGLGIVGTGVALTVKAFVSGSEEALPRIAWRPLLCLLAAVIAFALALDRLGLVAATVLLILIGRFASPRPLGWIATIVLTVAASAALVVVFRELLGLPLKALPLL